jgi:hypothetical protein
MVAVSVVVLSAPGAQVGVQLLQGGGGRLVVVGPDQGFGYVGGLWFPGVRVEVIEVVDAAAGVPGEAGGPGDLPGAVGHRVELAVEQGGVADEPGQRGPPEVRAALGAVDLAVLGLGGVHVVELPR